MQLSKKHLCRNFPKQPMGIRVQLLNMRRYGYLRSINKALMPLVVSKCPYPLVSLFASLKVSKTFSGEWKLGHLNHVAIAVPNLGKICSDMLTQCHMYMVIGHGYCRKIQV